VAAVLGTLHGIGLDTLLGKASPARELVLALQPSCGGPILLIAQSCRSRLFRQASAAIAKQNRILAATPGRETGCRRKTTRTAASMIFNDRNGVPELSGQGREPSNGSR
jgi:hypothetical protein